MVTLAHIKEQSRLSLGSYGRPRMTEELKEIGYVWTREGWLYLAVILDLHSRRVIGWAVCNRMKRDLAIRALNMAIAREVFNIIARRHKQINQAQIAA